MPPFDLLIRNASVIDGTGSPAIFADVAVSDGKIVEVGSIPPEAMADEELDAGGRTLAPGFIDIHTHADIALLARPNHLPKVMQGVTTEVFTNCGLGFAPCTPEAMGIQRQFLSGLFGDAEGVDWGWKTVGDFLDRFEKQGTGTNIAYLIPHGAVRVSVMGMEARPADSSERAQMETLVTEGMNEGAWGMSTGLWYAPMCHADRAENVALCRAAGLFATHQRDYGSGLFDATAETIAIAEEAGVPVQLSHLQLGGRQLEGRSGDILEMIDAARGRGIDITYDSYPYGAGSTFIQAVLPGWATDGGPEATLRRLSEPETRATIEDELSKLPRDWDRHVLAGATSAVNRGFEGMTFRAIAEKRGLTVPGFICNILFEDEMNACFIVHQMEEPDIEAILRHPAQMIGSDGLHLSGRTHPRLYGTFPRVIAHYARDRGALTLEQAIYKMTSQPAERLGLKGRGRIATGFAADLTLFDPGTIKDVATYDDPIRFPDGIPFVFVNGVAVKRDDKPTNALPGHVLRKR